MMQAEHEPQAQTLIGVGLAVLGSAMVGISYTASKTAHNKVMGKSSGQRAAAGASNNETAPLLATIPEEGEDHEDEYSITETMKHPEWWMSMALLTVGEICNFMAYGYAPTSVIATLGTMSIIAGALSGYFYLGERIRPWNMVGMLVSVLGAIIIVMFSRAEEPQLSPEAIMEALSQLQFIIYASAVSLVAVGLVILDSTPIKGSRMTYGDKWMFIRVSLTAIFSGFTVLCTKSISSLLTLTWYKMLSYWVSYVLILALVATALLGLYYTNKALSRFDSTSVLPAEFAAFTLTAVSGSAVLYNDFAEASLLQIGMFVVGCLTTFLGVHWITGDDTKHPQKRNSTVPKAKPNRASMMVVAGALPMPLSEPIVPQDDSDNDGDDDNLLYEAPVSSKSTVKTPAAIPSASRKNLRQTLMHVRFPHVFDETDIEAQTEKPSEKETFPEFAKRMSRTGVAGLATMANALGANRASLTFQHVLLHNNSHDEDDKAGQSDEDVPGPTTPVLTIKPIRWIPFAKPHDDVEDKAGLSPQLSSTYPMPSDKMKAMDRFMAAFKKQ